MKNYFKTLIILCSSALLSFTPKINISQNKEKKYADEILRLTNLGDFNNFLKFNSRSAENLLIKKSPSLEEKRKQWHESLSKDIYIDEALNVLSEIKMK